MNELRKKTGEMEQIRRKMQLAWDKSGGDYQNPDVQKLADQFDRAMLGLARTSPKKPRSHCHQE